MLGGGEGVEGEGKAKGKGGGEGVEDELPNER